MSSISDIAHRLHLIYFFTSSSVWSERTKKDIKRKKKCDKKRRIGPTHSYSRKKTSIGRRPTTQGKTCKRMLSRVIDRPPVISTRSNKLSSLKHFCCYCHQNTIFFVYFKAINHFVRKNVAFSFFTNFLCVSICPVFPLHLCTNKFQHINIIKTEKIFPYIKNWRQSYMLNEMHDFVVLRW